MRRFETKNYTKSGGIGINVTRNQDTPRAVSLQLIGVVQGHCRLLRFYNSGHTGIDIIPNPFLKRYLTKE